MDLDEVRNAFLFGDPLADRAIAFRDRRLDTLHANQGPVPLTRVPLFVAHVVPLQTLTRRQTFAVEELLPLSSRLQLACSSGHTLREAQPSYKGVICAAHPNRDNEIPGYAQLFRDGCMEIVGASFDTVEGPVSSQVAAPPAKVESYFIGHNCAAIFQTMDALRVAPPALVFINWLNTGNVLVRLPTEGAGGSTRGFRFISPGWLVRPPTWTASIRRSKPTAR